MTSIDAVPADKPEKPRRYKRNRGTFRGLDLRTVRGRRIRALYAPYMEQAGLDDANLVHQSAVLKVAKLQVIVERLQNELLKSKNHSVELGDELVRHENMLRRAKEELPTLTPKPVKWWEQEDDDDAKES
jgi:hypothetical protein